MGQFLGQKLESEKAHDMIMVQQEQGYCVSIATSMMT